jgi:hypothetical protein
MWTLFCNVCINFWDNQIWKEIMIELNCKPSCVIVTKICVNNFFGWLSPNLMKWGEIALINGFLCRWMYWQKTSKVGMVDDHELKEEPHFASWCLCYFILFLFLLFASYGIWCVVFHGMLTPKSEVGGGLLFSRFALVVWWRSCRIVEWRKDALGQGRKYISGTMIKAKDFGFLTQIHLNFILWFWSL